MSEKTEQIPFDDLIAVTYAWNSRKRQLTPRQIDLAAKVLEQHA